jgi:two-component system, LytTR family, sensor kinase
MPMSDRRPSRLRFALIYAAAWSPVAIMSFAGSVITRGIALVPAAVEALTFMGVGGLLGLPIWALTGYLDARVSRRRAVAIHLVAALAYAVVVAEALQAANGLRAGPQPAPMRLDLYRLSGPLFLYLFQLVAMLGVRNFVRAEKSRQLAAVAEQARVTAESMRARAELQALRAHLDPHFLFNTLNAIAAVVETDPSQARQMLVRAGALLRRVLDLGASGRDTVTVADEWAIVSEYLSFERLRMGDRLRVESAFSDDALDCEIPAFILQPLVENAIRHGLFPQPTGGTLRVTGLVEGPTLTLEVSDTGAGAAAHEMDHATGFGLRAARERMRGAFGAAARIDVETAPGCGFCVRLSLPAHMPAAEPAATGASP